LAALQLVTAGYLLGAGIYDLTGESTEGGFMGYAVPAQRGTGIHVRPRSRAFIFVDQDTGLRTVYISTDLCMGDQMVKYAVVEKVQAALGPSLYTHENIIFSGTHTHGTPGGLGGTALVDITTFGFLKNNFDAAVLGISQSIIRAHNNLRPGTVKINSGILKDANINRSPASYDKNPQAEKDQYDGNADTLMTILRLDGTDGSKIGMISFFPVHGTSMNNTNTLVSGDNKGYASQLFEKAYNAKGTLPGKGSFIAAFGQTHAGDISPNTRGPKCPDGSPCDYVHSTCGGLTEGCIATGPGRDQFESTQIIGQKQFDKARELYESATKLVTGPIDMRYRYYNFQNISVSPNWTTTGQKETTCEAALGYSFAAGTTDGPGDFDFTQGTNTTNPFWSWLAAFLAKPTPEQIKCQAPKPILLDVGLIKPIPWVSYILPIQITRIGQFYILGLPSEFSTMAGRRLKNTVKAALQRGGQWTADSHIEIAGLSNSYSHYCTTFEEYQVQRYEGASTLYGPHTLAAYQQEFDYITFAMTQKQPVPLGPLPMDMRNHTFSFALPPTPDAAPAGRNFGDVLFQPNPTYRQGQLVSAQFVGATLRNDLFTERTFLTIERQNSTGSWEVLFDDSAWETKLHWKRVGHDHSTITIEWQTDSDAPVGSYRINHYGAYKKALDKTPTQFSGRTAVFQLTP